MHQKPELELGEIVASVIAATIASSLMATTGLTEATAQASDGDTAPEPDPKPSQAAVDEGLKPDATGGGVGPEACQTGFACLAIRSRNSR